MMEAERLKEFAARRAGILSMSSAWGHDDDAALLNQLLARITDLEAQLAAKDAEIAAWLRRRQNVYDEPTIVACAVAWGNAIASGDYRKETP